MLVGYDSSRDRRTEAGIPCLLPGEREVAGPRAVALAAGGRAAVAFAFGDCLWLELAGLLLFGFGFADALLLGPAFAAALLFGFVFAEALLFGLAFARCFGFLGLVGFVAVEALRSS